MTFRFHPEALAEFEGATRYYAAIQNELAQRFVSSVEIAIEELAEQPLAFALMAHDVRRCLTRVFPYAVLYTIEVDYILIVAVMHCHQEPGYWRHRTTPQT
ncbi:plasmid stabilization protein [Rhodanobacter sp. B05]|uniref:type II toxin-antitoxin system RelE/ParE family toxin n=1 Tax=Rhodanobacter sp. B05 TaxID=1945859 RepID=UPI00098718C3|nr:type II toxin-antitoxin system RelE/ParE family toxin [Rhodanobacter sp. B05]OOG59126.1 plasmid stabilization protein [Rhodanobacter sp. B05]